MLYFLYITGFTVAKILPIRLCYLIAEVTAYFYSLFARRDREELTANLKVVLGEDADGRTINRHILEIFKHFAKYLADFIKFTTFDKGYIEEHIDIQGLENLDKCLEEGKGAVIVSLHLGNWELGGAVVGGLGYSINGLVLEHKNKRINDFFIRQRDINSFKSIPLGISATRSISLGISVKECFKALKRNEIVAIVGDKDYTSGGIPVEFFGQKAVLPKGPAVLSLRTGAPIVFTILPRVKDNKFRLILEEPIKHIPTGDHEKDIRELMAAYIRIFEKYIRQYPDQWYAFRKLWNPGPTTQ